MTEKEIFAQIEEKKSLIEKINKEINSLEYQIHQIYKEKILSKFKIGDILTYSEEYYVGNTNDTIVKTRIFKLECFDSAGVYGYARTQHILFHNGITKHYEIYPQPVVKLDLLLKYGRKANKEETKHFKEVFKK